jgi:hypothetical protein
MVETQQILAGSPGPTSLSKDATPISEPDAIGSRRYDDFWDDEEEY